MTKVVDITGKLREQREKEKIGAAGVGVKKVNTRIESWMCPECGARHVGWSSLNICSTCGYREASRS